MQRHCSNLHKDNAAQDELRTFKSKFALFSTITHTAHFKLVRQSLYIFKALSLVLQIFCTNLSPGSGFVFLYMNPDLTFI
jgi:hypothetical protein